MPQKRHLLFATTLLLGLGLAACSNDTPNKPNPQRVWERVVPLPDEVPDLRAVSIFEDQALAVAHDGFAMTASGDEDWKITSHFGYQDFATSASSATFSLAASEYGEIIAFGSDFIDGGWFDVRWRAACGTYRGVLVVGDEGGALFTDDGRTFDPFSLPTGADLTDCVWQRGYYISDEDGFIWEAGGTSDDPDFSTWTNDGVALEGGIRSFWKTRESSRFVAVGADGALYRREWGETTWTHEYSAGDAQFRDVNDGYAVGDGGLVVKGDGLVWNRIDLGTSVDLRSVARDGNRAWIVGVNGSSYRSDDTVTFTRRPIGRPLDFRATHWSREMYVIGGAHPAGVLLSEDGERWRRPEGTHPENISALAGNGSRVVATSRGRTHYSDDLETWTEELTVPADVTLNELVWTGTRFVGVHYAGSRNGFVSSESGRNFRPLAIEVDARIDEIVSFRGDVIMFGLGSRMYLLNEDDEVIERSRPPALISDAAYHGDYLYAVGEQQIWRTKDLEVWSQVFVADLEEDDFLFCIAGGRGLVATSYHNAIFESDDGATWTRSPSLDTTHQLRDAVWGRDGWVLVGTQGAIYTK